MMDFASDPISIIVDDLGTLDEQLESLPAGSAIYSLWAREGKPLLGRTSVLRRRMKRLLRERTGSSRLLNLRSVVRQIDYWPVASRLESSLVFYDVTRRFEPDTYLETIKLRMPPYVKLLLGNRFPRTTVTSRLSASGFHYGPFRTRATAEYFEQELLDLFQVRRCQEDLEPSPEHPGCMYGEMNRCLRPCQGVVNEVEYASEVQRLRSFLETEGHSLVQIHEAARERFSSEMEFEEAARQHRRIEKIGEVLKLRDDLVREVDQLNGIAVMKAVESGSVTLLFVKSGALCPLAVLPVHQAVEQSVSLDARLRELVESARPLQETGRERQEHLALVARWFYSSWRDGEWIFVNRPDKFPYRKLVGAISRMA